MFVKKGRFYYYYLDNEEVSYEINNWITPFGLEEFGKKSILNLKIPNTNDGENIRNILNHICNDIKSEFDSFCKIPIKNNLLRCEINNNMIIEKNEKVSGVLKFKIYNFRGNWGISIILN